MKHALLVLAIACFLPAATPCAAEVPQYTIRRTCCPIVVDGCLCERAWHCAKPVGEFTFPWHTSGAKEATTAKLLWDDRCLYVSFVCQDAHISAKHTRRDEPVYMDDCVEIFAVPNEQDGQNYFNFEMNVLGALLDQHHPKGKFSGLNMPWNASGVQVAARIAGTLNDDSDTDRYWVLEAAIPFENFRGTAPQLPPQTGEVWRLNLNRCGGATNEQFSQWSPAPTEKPDFHQPASFGRVQFSDTAVGCLPRTLHPRRIRVLWR